MFLVSFDSIIFLLIIFFIFLLSYQVFLEFFKTNIIEGLTNEYSAYDTKNSDNALILSQKNAGNIESLKEQIDEVSNIKPTVDELKQHMELLNSQVQDLVKQQAEFAQQIAGNKPPEVTGAD
jgi:predicted nuclease with TOPRIM domain